MDDDHRRRRKKLRILMFPLPFQGHINPMIQLAKILHSKGFEITIIHTKYNSPNPSNHPQFTFIGISDNLSEEEASSLPPIRILQRLITTCAEAFEDCLARLMSEDAEKKEISCLVTDVVWYFAQEVSEKLKIPRVALQTSSVCCFLGFSALPLLKERGYLVDMDSSPDRPIPELTPLRVKDIPFIRMLEPEDADHLISNMIDTTRKSSGTIYNSFEAIEGPELKKLSEEMGFTNPSFLIGPFHRQFPASTTSLLTQDRTCLLWLDRQAPRSVLYVSFGSVVQVDERTVREMAHGLARSGQPFIWAVRPGFVLGSPAGEPIDPILPRGFLEDVVRERGCMVNWAPQQEILSHNAVGGFWTHCGWNSTLEGICEGVPMICSYFSSDQKVNSRYVNDVWRVGIKLEKGIEREEIDDSITKLMKGREGEEMRGRAAALKEKSEFCLKTGGSSYVALNALTHYIESSLKSL